MVLQMMIKNNIFLKGYCVALLLFCSVQAGHKSSVRTPQSLQHIVMEYVARSTTDVSEINKLFLGMPNHLHERVILLHRAHKNLRSALFFINKFGTKRVKWALVTKTITDALAQGAQLELALKGFKKIDADTLKKQLAKRGLC